MSGLKTDASGSQGDVRLHVNELPWGIQEGFDEGMGLKLDFNSVELNRYPDSEYKKLRKAIGDYVGVESTRVCLGNGSDELIGLIFMLLLKKGEGILVETPTFGEYERAAELLKLKVLRVKIEEIERSNRLKRIEERIRVEAENGRKLGMIVLCNPNNPTGELLTKESIKRFLETFQGYVLVDEAYIDFCKEESLIETLEEFPKLIILRTFSKGFGLAGIRLGYSVSSELIGKRLNEIRPPYNINGITEYVALEVLKKPKQFQRRIEKIIEERNRVIEELKSLGVSFINPFGNFILVKGQESWEPCFLEKLKERVIQKNIVLRYFEKEEMIDYFRFSLGKKEENDKLLEVLKGLCPLL